ncbi:MAG: hypothetical protein LBB67_05190 [Oscillospiraceae bacterium]|jgi:hypothetical protein|nr:hypothetical protein [Oscillospiraceae bacterium]
MIIRPLESNDENALRDLCLAQTPLRKRTQQERFVILQSFCQYYLACEAAHCFVAEENGVMIAAALCAPDFGAYHRRFSERYAPKMAQYGVSATATSKRTLLFQQGIAGRYRAHCQFLCREADCAAALPPLQATVANHLEALELRGVCAFVEKQRKQMLRVLGGLRYETLSKRGGIYSLGLLFD